jgi:hypothetical protein
MRSWTYQERPKATEDEMLATMTQKEEKTEHLAMNREKQSQKIM